MIRSNTLRIASGALLTALLLSACTPADPQAETSKALADGVLLPTYTQWSEADRRLAASSIAFCADNQTLDETHAAFRPEERRVGKECVSTCRSRWAPFH